MIVIYGKMAKHIFPQVELHFLEHFPEASQHPMFPQISQDALLTFITNDDLECAEIEVFRGVMRWVRGSGPGQYERCTSIDGKYI